MHTAIGLEIHAQLKTKTKLFCGCSADYFQKAPNTQTCPVCLGMPGALPVLNRQAQEFALRVALALNCQIPPRSKFDRKNYFYPDLPKGYQISQYDEPLAVQGHLDFECDGRRERVRIRRVHLEEDAGKLLHDEASGSSLVDFNRAGVPLLEIVTEPDLASPSAAAAFMRALRQLLRYLDVCDGDMEKGSLRCDANISVSPDPQKLGTKTEVKNMNSFKAVEEALSFERDRQVRLLRAGEPVAQETLGWDADRREAVPQRGKEEAEDYRYFPEPDLVPLVVDEAWIRRVKQEVPELPQERRARFREQYGLPEYDIGVLTEEREIADYFEAVVSHFNRPKEVSNWIMGELLRLRKDEEDTGVRIPPQDFARLLQMVDTGRINRNTAKGVLEEAFKTGKPPLAIVEEQGLRQISDASELEALVDRVLAENPKQVEQYRGGKEKLLGWFVGQVMAKTQGKADPVAARRILQERLSA